MTELPPIIERLDGEWEARASATDVHTATISTRALIDAYPELRALVLRLQEERDTEREWGKAMQQTAGELEKERDALLEALKQAESYLEVNVLGAIREAIANVEGKDAETET